jgi:hypothetical protein
MNFAELLELERSKYSPIAGKCPGEENCIKYQLFAEKGDGVNPCDNCYGRFTKSSEF